MRLGFGDKISFRITGAEDDCIAICKGLYPALNQLADISGARFTMHGYRDTTNNFQVYVNLAKSAFPPVSRGDTTYRKKIEHELIVQAAEESQGIVQGECKIDIRVHEGFSLKDIFEYLLPKLPGDCKAKGKTILIHAR